MDTLLQEQLALGLVAIAVAVELLRRYHRRSHGKASCDGCETANKQVTPSETPLKFYKKH